MRFPWHRLCPRGTHIAFYSIVGVVAFFTMINYHTPYSTPWIYPPLAFYGFDLVMRMLRYRVKDAVLIAPDDQMTIVSAFFN